MHTWNDNLLSGKRTCARMRTYNRFWAAQSQLYKCVDLDFHLIKYYRLAEHLKKTNIRRQSVICER